MTDSYREIFERNPHPMWVYAIDTLRILAINEAAIAQYGYTREKFLSLTIDQVRPDPDGARLRGYVKELGHSTEVATSTWRHRRADGSEFVVDVSSTYMEFNGQHARMAVCVNASERAAMETALRRSRASLAEAQQLAHLGSWEIDLVTRQITWSGELYRILGASYASDTVSTLYEFDHPDDRELVRAAIERAEREHRPYKIDHRIITRDGRERHVQEQGEFFYDESGKPYRCVGAILDITERKHAEERLLYLAHHDSLTDLPNRALLTDRLVQSLGRARRRNRNVAVLFIDIDRFKSVNDTVGHEGGDAVLHTVAQRLRDLLRPGDTIARPGGDEFIIVLDDLASPADVQTIAQRVLAAIAEPIRIAEAELFVSGSIGIALSPDDGTTPDELLRNADAAMYVSKARGGDSIELFTAAIRRSTIEQLALESALRLALDREQIQVAYQPIVNARTGTVVALEALARWTDAEHGVVNPEQFIRVAEESGTLTLRLGEHVLRRSCLRLRSLLDQGHSQLFVSVNISPRQFREPDFAADVRRILEECTLSPQHLQLEITENAYISGVDASIRNIVALRRMGVRMTIDDFGTGFSALGYLKRLPVHGLKIDRSFIADIMHDAADQGIVRAIIAVANNLDLSVVAEGVENERQAEMLRDLGCHQLQGFYFGRPALEDAIEELLGEIAAV